MKREFRNAVKEVIKAFNDQEYKWTVTSDGLRWSYLDTKFTFVEEDNKEFLSVHDNLDRAFITIMYGDDKYADCKTLEEAYKVATVCTIRKAKYLY